MTTVTGKLLTINGAVPGAGTFVKFQLHGYEPNYPRVVGTNLIVDAIEFDAYPDNTGAISVAIQGNDTITPLNTFYHITIFQGGILYTEFDTSIVGNTADLNSMIVTGGCVLPPISGVPVPCIFDIFVSFTGAQQIPNQLLGQFIFPQLVILPTNLVGSMASAGVAATANTIISLQKNGVQFGTLTFGIGSSVGVFSGISTSFSTGDSLEVVGPVVPDLTLADINITLVGSI